MRPTLLAVCVVALALTAIGWTETEREDKPGGYRVADRTPRNVVTPPADGARSVSAQSTHPVSFEAKRWHPNRAWMRGALCIHRHESVDWHRRWTDWRGAPSPYAGGMQFTQSTWDRAGGRREPWQWAPREQLYRAWRIWRMYPGGSWVEWGTRGMCGL